ncbi:TrmH family RNA methyltransferase [Cellulomonas endophytica]|uniref:TrmH family RNA methyltransferase n=1 Tax=Cellulomonas endophytica TaxID=2494735 RepID=UPI001F0C0DAA|nr:RNA methyltransferase [Cellulomonas endophytica]
MSSTPAGPAAGIPDARSVPELTHPRAERVRSVRALAGRPVRERTGRFLVEGPQAVREAVAAGHVRAHALYATPEAAGRYAAVVAAAAARGVPVRLGTPEVLEAMSLDAQGLVLVADLLHHGLDEVLAGRPRLVAVLAHVRDPGNAGTVLRTADALGADAVVLTSSSVDVHNPKVVRSTAGSLFHLPVVTGPTPADAVAALRAAGLAVLAADARGAWDVDGLLDAVVAGEPGGPGEARGPAAGRPDRGGPGPAPDLRRPTAWLFGNEAWGLRPEDRDLADAVVRVDLRGRAESLNLATAAALCLHASVRAQR